MDGFSQLSVSFSSEAGAVLTFLLTFCVKTKSKSGFGAEALIKKQNLLLNALLVTLSIINITYPRCRTILSCGITLFICFPTRYKSRGSAGATKKLYDIISFLLLK